MKMCGFKSKIINDEDNDFGNIMIMALRYALGRRTYVTSEVSDFIKQNKMHLTEVNKSVMIRDIEEYLDSREKGFIIDDECDKDSFVDLLKFLKAGDEIEKKETQTDRVARLEEKIDKLLKEVNSNGESKSQPTKLVID